MAWTNIVTTVLDQILGFQSVNKLIANIEYNNENKAVMAYGTYTGDGTASQDIITVGFEPTVGIVFSLVSATVAPIFFRFGDSAGDSFRVTGGTTGTTASGISAFLASGFTVAGTGPTNANFSTGVYYYAMWSLDPQT